MGDFNCRTGKYSDSVRQERNTVITNDQSEFSSYGTQGNSIDNELNNHGKQLLKIFRNMPFSMTDNLLYNGLYKNTQHARRGK